MTRRGADLVAPSEVGVRSVGFKDELFQEYPDLVPAWRAFSDARAKRRAVEHGHVRDSAAQQFLIDHPDPPLP